MPDMRKNKTLPHNPVKLKQKTKTALTIATNRIEATYDLAYLDIISVQQARKKVLKILKSLIVPKP